MAAMVKVSRAVMGMDSHHALWRSWVWTQVIAWLTLAGPVPAPAVRLLMHG
jgi:hypothetical protein